MLGGPDFFNAKYCGRLILGKISKICAFRYQILRPKCTIFDSHPSFGVYSTYPELVVFKGPTSKGRRGEEGMERMEGGREGGKGLWKCPWLCSNWQLWCWIVAIVTMDVRCRHGDIDKQLHDCLSNPLLPCLECILVCYLKIFSMLQFSCVASCTLVMSVCSQTDYIKYIHIRDVKCVSTLGWIQ